MCVKKTQIHTLLPMHGPFSFFMRFTIEEEEAAGVHEKTRSNQLSKIYMMKKRRDHTHSQSEMKFVD